MAPEVNFAWYMYTVLALQKCIKDKEYMVDMVVLK